MMSNRPGMLRTRRRDVNVKPNRRLDRKSSRGMIYENEELRLRTININAEIERGQSDIKKLRRENEQLRKEIWCLRDEYEKLDKLLKDKDDQSCSSCTSETESCSSEFSETEESNQNLENVHKTTNMHSLRHEFDHLSVVTEETSAECSDRNSNTQETNWNILPPDQSYPTVNGIPPNVKHFFSPINNTNTYKNFDETWTKNEHIQDLIGLVPCEKTASDIIVKTDGFPDFPQETQGSNSFTNGGNLEELLQEISQECQNLSKNGEKPYKSEINVVLMPKPMDIIGEELQANIENLKKSSENLANLENLILQDILPESTKGKPFDGAKYEEKLTRSFGWKKDVSRMDEILEVKPEENPTKTDEIPHSEGLILGQFPELNILNYGLQQNSDNYFSDSCDNAGKNEEKSNKINEEKTSKKDDKEKDEKGRKTRKVSIYFKGKKDKKGQTEVGKKGENVQTDKKQEQAEKKPEPTISKVESKTSIYENSDKLVNSDTKTSSDSRSDRKHRKSSSTSPERKHHHPQPDGVKKQHKKRHKKRDQRSNPLRRHSVSVDRSFSVCTDRSHALGEPAGGYGGSGIFFDDFTTSERERTNSLSSCDTSRKNSVLNLPSGGKIPWFGCWGNGCI